MKSERKMLRKQPRMRGGSLGNRAFRKACRVEKEEVDGILCEITFRAATVGVPFVFLPISDKCLRFGAVQPAERSARFRQVILLRLDECIIFLYWQIPLTEE